MPWSGASYTDEDDSSLHMAAGVPTICADWQNEASFRLLFVRRVSAGAIAAVTFGFHFQRNSPDTGQEKNYCCSYRGRPAYSSNI